MAIRITSDNEKELMAAKHVFESGILNVGKLFLERNNLPTKLDVTYELKPKFPLIKNIIDKCNHKRKRLLEDIKYIVMHMSCCPDPIKVFKSKQPVLTSYVVDPDKVTMTSEDDYYPWALGNGNGRIVNQNSISVMLVSDLRGRTTEETIQLAAKLVKELMKKYNIPLSQVVRYTDVRPHCGTGDFNNPEVWQRFLQLVQES